VLLASKEGLCSIDLVRYTYEHEILLVLICLGIPQYTSNRFMKDAQINTCFSIYEPIFACTSYSLSQTDHCSRCRFSGSNGKLIFVLRVFALQAVSEEERIKFIN
jgi:hypothetical protein